MYWHITFRSKDGFVLFHRTPDLLQGVWAVTRIAEDQTLLWCIVDTHLHRVVHCDRTQAGLIARGVAQAVHWRLPDSKLGPASIDPVNGAPHLGHLVDYVLSQTNKHKLCGQHRALWGGSCFQDLVGARLVSPKSKTNLQAALPRMTDSTIWKAAGLYPQKPATDSELCQQGLGAITTAAAAALALPSLRGKRIPALQGRIATVHLARHLKFSARQVARALELTPRSVHNLTSSSANPDLLRAIRLQISIRTAASK